jgi:hypothetical protein
MEQTPSVGIDRLLEILHATGKKYDLDKIKAAYDYAHENDLICQATCSYASSWLSAQKH